MSNELFPVPYTLGWDGKVFDCKVLGLDTETEMIADKSHYPRVALAAVSDGQTNIILKPEQVDRFLSAHSSHTFVCHNAAFDFWALEPVSPRVWNLVESNRLHDTMYLDMLIRLAEGLGETRAGSSEGHLYPRNLGKLATAYADKIQLPFAVDKESPYRLRFGELLTQSNWSQVEPGFFEYAAGDPMATVRVYHVLWERALALCQEYDIPGNKLAEYGPLTHHLQVRAAIALLRITRNGIGFDPAKVKLLEMDIRQGLNDDLHWLDTTYPGLFQRYKKKNNGGFKYTTKSDLPSLSTSTLRSLLENICKEQNIPIPLSEGKTANLLTTKTTAWEPYKDRDPLIRKFLNLNTTSKLLSFFNIFHENPSGRIHPSYQVLMRTGRTSSSQPNIQQMPGDKEFRSLFVPSPGKKYAVIDYAFIELRTLAAICEQRFGTSVLADTIRRDIDPHVYTAAMIQGIGLDEFSALKETKPKFFKDCRQSAKALNFGIPGGLGAASLADYAKLSYGVDMSKEQAQQFRKRLIYEIYPEIGRYLADSAIADLSRNLGIPEQTIPLTLKKISLNPSSAAITLSNAMRLRSKSDFKYDPRLWDKCWEVMGDLLRLSLEDFSHLADNVKHKTGGMDFFYEVFATTAMTMTGRVRGSCTYTQARNTPFQSLAADGAKRALWRLVREKFHPVAFVHDEIVLEVINEKEAEHAKHIMESEMFEAVERRVPIACSLSYCDYWEK